MIRRHFMRRLITRSLLLSIFLLAFAGLFSTTSHAQDLASITGVITDSSGALIPGSTVELSNPSTGVSYNQTSDKIGSYRFANVPPGQGYRVKVTHDGFSVGQVSDIQLFVGVTRTQNITLAVGAEAQTIAISAGNQSVTLDTTDASIGNNIDPEELNDLPVYDRTRGISTLFYQ